MTQKTKNNLKLVIAAVLVIGVALGMSYWSRGETTPDDETLTGSCTIGIYCDTILDNIDLLAEEKRELVPEDGVLFAAQTVAFAPGESAFDVLQRTLKDENIHMEFSGTVAQQSVYIQGIGNLYELDCGERSGWLYYVNRDYPTTGISQHEVQEGDLIEIVYSCDWGEDITMEPLD